MQLLAVPGAGQNKPSSVEFIAVGGGANGTGGNWTNNEYGTGGGGGGTAAGTLTNPTSGTVTVGAAEADSVFFGNTGYKGARGSDSQQPPYSYGGTGGGRSTTGGGNGGNGGTVDVAGSAGFQSSITGVATYYGGGGGGSSYYTGAAGGSGGGGSGGGVTPGDSTDAGGTNTGGGGGGNPFGAGASGGSGVVIMRYTDTFDDPVSIGAGLTYTKTTSGGYKIFKFTAGTGTVTF